MRSVRNQLRVYRGQLCSIITSPSWIGQFTSRLAPPGVATGYCPLQLLPPSGTIQRFGLSSVGCRRRTWTTDLQVSSPALPPHQRDSSWSSDIDGVSFYTVKICHNLRLRWDICWLHTESLLPWLGENYMEKSHIWVWILPHLCQ